LHSQWIVVPRIFDDLAFCVGDAYELLGGGFKIIFKKFTPTWGDFFQFDLRIFFKWVGSTTN